MSRRRGKHSPSRRSARLDRLRNPARVGDVRFVVVGCADDRGGYDDPPYVVRREVCQRAPKNAPASWAREDGDEFETPEGGTADRQEAERIARELNAARQS